MASTGICLDVAIDHRIRQLLKPSVNPKLNPNRPDGEHVEKLRQLHPFVNKKRHDASSELLVTEELAKPLSQGGIVVALLRPADYHPFSSGVGVVVEKSPTLRALREVFALVGLDLVQHITVLDSLPFLSRSDKSTMFGDDDEEYTGALNDHHEAFLEAVVAKRPDVVLCMWQTSEELQCNWSGSALESIGVGELFDNEKVTLCDRHGNRIETQRVNVFHPSYCMNHLREYSQLRQLFMLEIAHAWHLMDSTWREEPWIAELRDSWKKKKSHLDDGKPEGVRTEPHELYAKAVAEIQNLLPELKSSDKTSDKLYKKLTKANWTQHMNDASLCLRATSQKLKKIYRGSDIVEFHHTIGSQGDMAIRTMGLVMDLAMKLARSVVIKPRIYQGNGFFSESFVEHLRGQKKRTDESWFRNGDLKRGLIDFLLELNDAFSDADLRGPIRLQMSLGSASEAFLTLANKMEGLLSTLAGYPDEEAATEDRVKYIIKPPMASEELVQKVRDLGIL